MSSANAATPSASATSSDSRMVASVDPSATVTIRSKAFIFASVRFPATRTRAISATYARAPTTSVRQIPVQSSKNMRLPVASHGPLSQ